MSERLRGRAAILAIIGLMLAWGLPELGLGPRFAPGGALGPRLAREAIWWAFGFVILLWVTTVERRPLASIGLTRPSGRTIGWALLFALLMLASVMLSYAVILPALGLRQDMATTRAIIAVPLWLQSATMVRAGVVEEILYRGYPFARIEGLSGSRVLAFVAVAVTFTLAHHGWAPSQLIVAGVGAMILTALYAWRRNLLACMVAHILVDVIGFGLARAQS